MYFSKTNFRNCIFVLFLMNWSKYKHFRSSLHEVLHLIHLSSFIVSIQVLNSGRSPFVFSIQCQIATLFVKKFCFSVMVLSSIKVKYSRFISGEQLQFLDSVSFLFRIEIEGEIVSCLYRPMEYFDYPS